MLHYEISGKGTENLVLLHGLMENSDIWKMMEPFLHQDFKLIKIDLPGHGKSPRLEPELTMNSFAKKVNETLTLLNIHHFHLLGHSLGGYVSLAFQKMFPKKIKSLVLFFSNYLQDTETKILTRQKSIKIIKENFPLYAKATTLSCFDENNAEHLKTEIDFATQIALSTQPEEVIKTMQSIIHRENQTSLLENSKTKITIIAGNHDQAIDTKEMIKNLPQNNEIAYYTLNCGHNGHLEKPEICASILKSELL